MFGLNRAEVIGRLGADVTVNHLTTGGRVANMSIATDESYLDRNAGERVEKTEWHRVVTFQPGLVDMLENHVYYCYPDYDQRLPETQMTTITP